MNGFVSRVTNKIDRKGRVSIPAPFRQVLSRDGYEGLYCYPSIDMEAVDCGGNLLLNEIERNLTRYTPFSEDHDLLSTAFYGSSVHLTVDGEGRIGLTPLLLEITGITDEVTFVGQGYKFQIWEPSRFQTYELAARERARALRRSPRPEGAA